MIFTFTFLTITFYIVGRWILKNYVYENKKSPPVYPCYIPIVGHAHLSVGCDDIMLLKRVKEIAEVCNEQGGIMTYYLGPLVFYMITDPEDSNFLLNECLQKSLLHNLVKPLLGNGLFTAPVDIWTRHRKLVNHTFSQKVLEIYLTTFNEQSKIMADALEAEVGKGEFNHIPYVNKLSLANVCIAAMGIDDDNIYYNPDYMKALAEMFTILTKRGTNPFLHNDFLFSFTQAKKEHDKTLKILLDMSEKVIKKRKASYVPSKHILANLEDHPRRNKSFLDYLLEISHDGSFTEEELRHEVDTMIVAGYDTTASVQTILMVLIGSYTKVQDKIFAELQEVFNGSDRDVTKEDLSKLVYLEAVIKEGMRLFPLGIFLSRYIKQDIHLKKYTLSAGSTCLFITYGIHTHPSWGPDRFEFKPERWLNPENIPKHGFIGFGGGRRNCIGKNFAMMSLKTSLSNVLRRYVVKADHSNLVLRMEGLISKPSKGHFIKIEKRN